ncbi:MAG: rhamnulokinase [Treponema sp.]|jgi:rhamnulokinase|nr:rhamnulokinase [Treponema sp.]
MNYYLAIDIGASSGRHIVGWLEDGRLRTREVYRFDNNAEMKNGHLCWNIDALYAALVAGLKRCKDTGMIPYSLGIDTWGVDFVLIDGAGGRLGDAVCYRDSRTDGMDAEVEKIIPYEELYKLTGIAKQPFNTVYQLTALKKESPELLEKAERLLMMPDYLHYLLSGIASNEYTEASTGALVGARERNWNGDIIKALGFPVRLFRTLNRAGDGIGVLSKAVEAEAGFSCRITLPATHDTGSAFLAVPAAGDSVYISSGTWSLLGIESTAPIITNEAREANFTNEGGFQYRYRFLKNIMGLWMVQSVRKELGKEQSFDQLARMAEDTENFGTVVDVNNLAFFAPQSMIGAVKEVAAETGQPPPRTTGELMQCLYRSLALSYRDAVTNLERIAGKRFGSVNLVGGGSKDDYLNRLTARFTGLPVYAGPVEATVAGNLIVQMISSGELSDLAAARGLIARSFDVKPY